MVDDICSVSMQWRYPWNFMQTLFCIQTSQTILCISRWTYICFGNNIYRGFCLWKKYRLI